MAASGVFLAVIAAGVLVAPLQIDSYDATIMAEVGHNLLLSHSVRVTVDPFHINSPYSSYGIGMSLLMGPAFWLGPQTGRTAASVIMLINPLVVALTAVAVLLWGLAAAANPRQAVMTALVTVFATPLFAYTATAFSEPGVALGIALGLLGLEQARSRRYARGCLIAGLGAGISLLMRPDSVVLVVPILAVAASVLCVRRAPQLAWFVVGIAPAVLVTAWYNYVRFGSPVVTQYEGMPAGYAFSHPILTGLYGLTLSPGRGLLLYAPIVVLAAICVPWAWQRSRLITLTALGLIILRIVVYAPWISWEAGVVWGPRFLVPAMPALALLLLEAVRRWGLIPRSARALMAGLIAVSIIVQVIGAAEAPAGETLWVVTFAQIAPQYSRDIIDHNLLDWRYFPILDSAQQILAGRNLTSRYLHPLPHRRAIALLLAVMATGLLASLLSTRASRPDASPASP